MTAMYLKPGRDIRITATGPDPRRISPPEPAAEYHPHPLARPSSTTDTSARECKRPEEDAHRLGHPWVARFGVSWISHVAPQDGPDGRNKSSEEDMIPLENQWVARLGVGWLANTIPETELVSRNEQSKQDTVEPENQWIARFGTGWLASTMPETELVRNEQSKQDTVEPENQWIARFGTGWLASTTPKTELFSRNEEDIIGPENQWIARFGTGWLASTTPETELFSRNEESEEDIIGPENQWTERLGVGWAHTRTEAKLKADDEMPRDDPARRQSRARHSADSAAAPRQDDETSALGQPSESDLSGPEDQSPAVEDAALMATEIELSRRRLEEMAEQEDDVAQLRDVAAHIVNRAGTILGLLKMESCLSRRLATRASVAEAERDMAREAAAVESRERQQLNSQLSEMRQQVSTRQREADAFKHSAGEERDELWERVKESDAANRRLQTRLSRATSENEALKKEVDDIRGELDEIQERNHELQVDLASCEGSRQTIRNSWIRQNIKWGEDIVQRKRKSEQQGTMNREVLEVFKRAEDTLQRARNLEQQGTMKKEVLEGPEEEHSNRPQTTSHSP